MTPIQAKIVTEFMIEFGPENITIIDGTIDTGINGVSVLVSNGINRVWIAADGRFEYSVNPNQEVPDEDVPWSCHRGLPNPAVRHRNGDEYWIHGKQTNVDCGLFLEWDEKTKTYRNLYHDV